MVRYNNFENKNNKNTKDRYDIYEPAFESPLKESEYSSNTITKHIEEFTELCSFLRWMPDIFWDMYKPEEGGLIFDLHQRVMLRELSRFGENYFCAPRGISKTLIHIMNQYHTACCFPNITTSVTASTKESAVKIWKDKHDEILRFYPSFASNIKSANFSKDSGRVEFINGSVVDSLANSQQSKGLRRRRGGLEESALIDKETYDDAIEPIFNMARTTMTGATDPEELNGQINRYSTSGYKNSDEYEKILKTARDMIDLKGSFVFGSDWFIPVHFGRQKKSTIDKSRNNNIIRFRQNYLCDWIGCVDGALINISKLIKARTLSLKEIETECPVDKNKNYLLNEYVIGMDVARSASQSNNKSAIVVLKIIRNQANRIRQVQVVNIITPPNGLNFEEQSIIVKRVFKRYGGSLDLTKSRVKAVVVDANSIGQGIVEKLLEDVTDPETNEELGCWATINTEDKPKVANAPAIVYSLKAQGINGDIIRTFINYAESNKLKLAQQWDDLKEEVELCEFNTKELETQAICIQTQNLIDQVANLKIRETKSTSGTITVDQVIKKIDKDIYSGLVYALYYVAMFLDVDDDDSSETDLSNFVTHAQTVSYRDRNSLTKKIFR